MHVYYIYIHLDRYVYMNAYRYMSLCMYTDIYIHHMYIEIHTHTQTTLVFLLKSLLKITLIK